MKKILLIIIAVIVVLPLSLIRPDIPVKELEKKYFSEQSRYMNINGLKVHYRDEGKGFPLVLLHGVGASLHTWEPWVKILKNDFRVIRFDLPPFGLTGPRKDKKYSLNDYVKLPDSFLKKLNIKKLYMGGNSLGAIISLGYANRFPQKVLKLVAVDGAHKRPEKAPPALKITQYPMLSSIVQKMTPRFLVKMILQGVYGNSSKLSEKTVDRYFDLLRREGSRQGIIDRTSSMTNDRSIEIKKIKAKTLILWGKKDSWIPVQYGKMLHKDLSGSQLIIYEEAGHVPMEELPHRTVKDVKKFLEE